MLEVVGIRAHARGATSANDETTRRGCTLNQARWEVRPRSRSMTGCGLKTPFVSASATNASASSAIWNCSCERARELGVEERLRPGA